MVPPPAQEALPSPLNNHMYPSSVTAVSSEKLTLSGFEGPEKLLEIWFRKPTSVNVKSSTINTNVGEWSMGQAWNKDSNNNKSSGLASHWSPSRASSMSGRSESHSVDSGLDSITEFARVHVPHEEEWDRSGLRTVERAIWEEMLAIVKCQVLSVVSNECCDAYLLSESSMFVYTDRLILKTCGTTTLLNAVPRILEIAEEAAAASAATPFVFSGSPEAVFYSRKAFLFPERQLWPHGKWGDEVAYLDEVFPSHAYETSGYVIGKINGDHWCLYVASPHRFQLNDDGEAIDFDPEEIEADVDVDDDDAEEVAKEEDEFTSTAAGSSLREDAVDDLYGDEDEADVTLEIMMQELDPAVTKLFWRTEEELKETAASGVTDGSKPSVDPSRGYSYGGEAADAKGSYRRGERRILNETGIAQIYPSSLVDDFLFDPCGYSLNGLMGRHYWTIHVTPEDICSYASFETSLPARALKPKTGDGPGSETVEEVIQRVVDCFKPGKFSVTLFSHRDAVHARRRAVTIGELEAVRGRSRNGDAKKEFPVCSDDEASSQRRMSSFHQQQSQQQRQHVLGGLHGFRRVDCIAHGLGVWDLEFAHYVKSLVLPPSGGLSPRTRAAKKLSSLKKAGLVKKAVVPSPIASEL